MTKPFRRRVPKSAKIIKNPDKDVYGDKSGYTTWQANGALDLPRTDVYIGIDSSVSNLAIVSLDLRDKYHWWIHSPKVPTGATTADVLERLISHKLFLNRIVQDIKLRATGVAALFMENYGFSSQSLAPSAELAGIVKTHVHSNLRTPTLVAPTQLKKYATNNGRADKSDIKLAVYKHWGMEFKDDNLADAYVLARMAKDSVEGTDVKYRTEILEKLSTK